MNMKKVTVDDIESDIRNEGIDRWPLSEHIDATNVAINHYRIAPGDGFPGGLHAHMDQEEVFVVLDGEATFETMNGEVTVGEGEAIRFVPGEFQSGKNESDGTLAVLAMGAPRNSEDIRIPVDCPECYHDTLRLDTGDDGLTFVCPDCNVEHIPNGCSECGHDDLRVTLGEATRTVVVCQNCEAEFENPPLRD